MMGVIEFANVRDNRYAVCVESGDYAVFELHEGVDLEIGDAVEGDLDALGGEDWQSADHGLISVYVQGLHHARDSARRWVERGA